MSGPRNLPAPGEVDVHRLLLDRPLAAEHELGLRPEELERAARFRFERDRRRYVSGRAQLRVVLGGYLGVRAADVRFGYGEHGRPALHPDHAEAKDLVFNLAHSEGLGVLALATGGVRLGADIELLPAGPPPREVAEHFFAPAEVSRLLAIAPYGQAQAFYQCWTRKEAYLKALGGGLTIPLAAFEVAFGDRVPPTLRVTRVGGTPASRWGLHDISGWFPGAVAAIAVERAVNGPVQRPVRRLGPPGRHSFEQR